MTPKNKTHSGTKKCSRITGPGKPMCETASKRRLLEHKFSRRTRRLSQDQAVAPSDVKRVRKLLGK